MGANRMYKTLNKVIASGYHQALIYYNNNTTVLAHPNVFASTELQRMHKH